MVVGHLRHSRGYFMKRMKRNKEQRAFKQGYKQGVHGHPKEQCPYHSLITEREQWMSGWREGHASYVAGYRLTEELFV